MSNPASELDKLRADLAATKAELAQARAVVSTSEAMISGLKLEIALLLDLDAMIPNENYEGLTISEGEDGAITLWIIADDNIASFQRTLLAKLRWTPDSR